MHKSIHYHLYCFCLIRRSIPFPIAVTIEYSYIIPLLQQPSIQSPRLQTSKLRLQNYVVHCFHLDILASVHLLPRHSSDSITLLLKQLYWLSVSYRIKYKQSTKPYITTPQTTVHPFSIYTHPLLQSTPDQSNNFLLTTPHLHNIQSSHICSLALYARYHWNSLVGSPYPTTFEQ